MVCRGFASPVGSSCGLRGRNVTVGARQVHERWSAYTSFCATSIPTPRIHALRRDYIAFIDYFACRWHLRLATSSMTITCLLLCIVRTLFLFTLLMILLARMQGVKKTAAYFHTRFIRLFPSSALNSTEWFHLVELHDPQSYSCSKPHIHAELFPPFFSLPSFIVSL